MKKLSVFSMIGVILLNIGGIAYSQEYKDIVKDTSDCMPKSTNRLAVKLDSGRGDISIYKIYGS